MKLFIASLTVITLGGILAACPAPVNACKAPEPPKSYLFQNDHRVYREIDRELCNVCYLAGSVSISCVHLPLDVCTPTK